MSAETKAKLLRERAAQARQLAKNITDAEAVRGLLLYAEVQERKAAALEGENPVLPTAAAIPSGEPPIARAGAALKPETLLEPSNDDDPKV